MKDWITESLYVFAYSNSAQWQFMATVLLIFLSWLIGEIALANFELPGVMAPAAEAIRGLFEDRFLSHSLSFLFVGLAAVARQLRRDRKRLMSI